MPTISVIMSVYNGESYLKDSIDSILNQTFNDFQFIIVNDNSNDSSKEIILSYADERIIYLENKQNIGLASSLNKAIKKAKGIFIARMDDDDIAYADRFRLQVDFLESNPKIGIVGTYANLIGDRTGIRKHDKESDLLKLKSFFSCQFCHPTVMLRKAVLVDNNLNYNEAFTTAQDYELWSRLIRFTDFATIPQILLDYRFHDKQLSSLKRTQQIKNTEIIYANIFEMLRIEVSAQQVEIHKKLATLSFPIIEFSLSEIGKYIKVLIDANTSNSLVDPIIFNKFMSEYFYNIAKTAKINSIQKILLYRNLRFDTYFKPKFVYLKLLLA